MIESFEAYTSPLTEDEMQAFPHFREFMYDHVGKSRAVTNGEIAKVLDMHTTSTWSSARVRKFINRVRCSGFVPNLIASGNGYYVSHDPKEVERYIMGLWERCAAIASVAAKLEAQKDNIGKPYQAALF